MICVAMRRVAIERALALVALAVSALAWGCTPRAGGPPARGHSPQIRVLVGEVASVRVSANTAFDVTSGGMGLMHGDQDGTVEVTVDGRTLQARLVRSGTVGTAPDEVTVVPASGGEVTVDGVAYAGRMMVRVAPSGKLAVINVLPLESYLEGVVPHEIGDPGPDAYAALEAQAVTARTYALGRIAERRDAPFDVYAGVRDQVYRGRLRTSRAATAAVRDTRGVVLQYGGDLCRAYYCATCGGHTSDIRRVWPERGDAPYLRGEYDHAAGDPESFCSWVRNFRWRVSFTGRQLGETLRKTLPAELGVPADGVGSLIDVRVAERSPSGRVRRLDIETTTGTFSAEGDRIRWVLMTDADRGRILPSTMFAIERDMRGGRVSFISFAGGGNGHGVGMCQNGAIGMARKGYTFGMILEHYYPGTTLAQRY